jgi:hypothetical protein
MIQDGEHIAPGACAILAMRSMAEGLLSTICVASWPDE